MDLTVKMKRSKQQAERLEETNTTTRPNRWPFEFRKRSLPCKAAYSQSEETKKWLFPQFIEQPFFNNRKEANVNVAVSRCPST